MCVPLRVFISYSHRDAIRAQALAEDLTALGHQVWIDKSLTGGQSWWETILAELRAADVLAFVSSDYAAQSKACLVEIGYARQLKKLVVPVLVGGSVDILPADLRTIQHVDYRADDKPALRTLAVALRDFARSRPAAAAVAETVPPPPPPFPLISELRDRVASAELNALDQGQLVVALAECLNAQYQLDSATDLLRQLRRRKDITLKAARDVDELLGQAHRPEKKPVIRPLMLGMVLVVVCTWTAGAITTAFTEDMATGRLAAGLVALSGIAYLVYRHWLRRGVSVPQGS